MEKMLGKHPLIKLAILKKIICLVKLSDLSLRSDKGYIVHFVLTDIHVLMTPAV